MTSKQRRVVAAIILPVAVGGSGALVAYLFAEKGWNPIVGFGVGIAVGGSVVGTLDALASVE